MTPRTLHFLVLLALCLLVDRTLAQTTVTADDSVTGDRFGYAVAVAGDTLIVGAPENEENGFSSGAAYVFTRDNGDWALQTKLMPSDASTYERFGSAVAFDGDTAVIGAVWGSSAYVFTRVGNTWTEEAKLVSPTPSNDFGAVVALDGDTAVVGAPWSSDVGSFGEAYVFVRSGSSWEHQATFDPDTDSGPWGLDIFGVSVAISGDTAIVGQSRWVAGNMAYIYKRSGTTWAEEQVLVASDPDATASFAAAVALDGDTALVSAPSLGAGSVFAYQRSGDAWTEQAQLDAPSDDALGRRMVLTSNTLIVSGSSPNAAHLFDRDGGAWTHSDTFETLGDGWAFAATDTTIVAGDMTADVGGVAYVSSLEGEPWDSVTATDAGTGPACPNGVDCNVDEQDEAVDHEPSDPTTGVSAEPEAADAAMDIAGGCACRAAGDNDSSGWPLLFPLLLLIRRRNRAASL